LAARNVGDLFGALLDLAHRLDGGVADLAAILGRASELIDTRNSSI